MCFPRREGEHLDGRGPSKVSRAEAVAVSIYSHVFNSNPALDDVQTLILDDAHAAPSYVASPWSLEIFRGESSYSDVLAALAPALDPLVVQRLHTEPPDWRQIGAVYLGSPVGVRRQAAQLEQILSSAVAARSLNESARYAFHVPCPGSSIAALCTCRTVACYSVPWCRRRFAFGLQRTGSTRVHERHAGRGRGVGADFRTGQDRSYSNPKGLGEAGHWSSPVPFPRSDQRWSTPSGALDTLVRNAIAEHGRVLVLTPDERTASAFLKARVPEGYTVIRAPEVEDDLTRFTSQPRAALVLTNRYDGIDLPDDDCRLVIMEGLPARGDLQERFLNGSLGALEILQERIRARFVQGSGRATRNARDYSAVLVLGSVADFIRQQA